MPHCWPFSRRHRSPREVAIDKATFGDGPWRFFLEIRALGADKSGTLRYPSAAIEGDVSSWARLDIATPAATPSNATVLTIASKALNESRVVWIDAAAECHVQRRCDTLYVLDAHALFPLATAYATVMKQMGRMPPLIIVGVPSRSQEDRVRNFTDGANADEQRRFPQAGGAAPFTTFLLDELAPAIAYRYAVSSRRVLAGHSLAGLYAASLVAAATGFEGVIAISPTLGWNDQQTTSAIDDRLTPASVSGRRQFYMSVSEGDTEVYLRSFDRLRRLVEAKPVPWLQSAFERVAGEDHVTTISPALNAARQAGAARSGAR